LIEHVFPSGQAFYYRFDDASGRCVKTWGDGGLHEVDLAFDDDAGTTLLTATNEPRLLKWRRGLVVEERHPDGTLIKKLELDDDDFVVAEENGAGEKWIIVRDARGNVVAETDPAGNTIEWTLAGDLCKAVKRPDGTVTTFDRTRPAPSTGWTTIGTAASRGCRTTTASSSPTPTTEPTTRCSSTTPAARARASPTTRSAARSRAPTRSGARPRWLTTPSATCAASWPRTAP
jgi:YD repeat-containing protein